MMNQVKLKILLAGFFAGDTVQKFPLQSVFPEASQLKTFP